MKKRFYVVLAITIMLLSCFGSLSAYAAYVYGTSYTDQVSTTSSQDLAEHIYNYRDIVADPIRVTSPSEYGEQEYYLSLYTVQNGSYAKFGYTVRAGTATLGGSCVWLDANPTASSNYAYIRVEKKDQNGVSLGGDIVSYSRSAR